MFAAVRAGAGRSVDLPGGLRFEVRHHDAGFPRPGDADGGCPFPAVVPVQRLPVPGRAWMTSGFSIEAVISPGGRALPRTSGPDMACLDAALAQEPLLVRARRDGDRFHPLGMPGPVKLQDFFVGQHIPRGWRDRVPLVESPRGIVWVAGYRIAAWAKAPQGAAKTLWLQFRRTGS
jgi:tRNA(Ile)-lysidine synthase